MLDHGALVEDDLGDRIAEGDATGGSRVGLDDRCPAAGACEHHRQRMRHERGGAGVGDEHEVDRLCNRCVGRDPNEGSVLAQGHVKRRERLGLLAQQAPPQQGLERLAFLREHRGQAGEFDALGYSLQRRKSGGEVPVDKDQPRAAEIAGEPGDVCVR